MKFTCFIKQSLQNNKNCFALNLAKQIKKLFEMFMKIDVVCSKKFGQFLKSSVKNKNEKK